MTQDKNNSIDYLQSYSRVKDWIETLKQKYKNTYGDPKYNHIDWSEEELVKLEGFVYDETNELSYENQRLMFFVKDMKPNWGGKRERKKKSLNTNGDNIEKE